LPLSSTRRSIGSSLSSRGARTARSARLSAAPVQHELERERPAMVLDFAGVTPNPARDRVQVKLPLEEPDEPESPTVEHVEVVARFLTVPYLMALLTLDATGVRVGELEAARIGDLDEQRQAWLVRAAVSKTRHAGSRCPPTCSRSSSTVCRHARTATRTRRCSPA
jgi:integrase